MLLCEFLLKISKALKFYPIRTIFALSVFATWVSVFTQCDHLSFWISDELISEVQDEGRRIRRRRKLYPTSPPHQQTDAAMQMLPSTNSWSSPLTAGSFSRDLLQVQCSGGFSPPRSISPGSLSPTRSREPTFTVKQVVSLCERLWKEREEKLREEYNQVLSDRLAGTYVS